jgi:hypothetical protein
MDHGWFKLYRRLTESDFWTSEPFTKPQAWVDLIALANHNPGSVWIRGVEINVKRGQTARSELTLASRWKWSRKKVRNFLKWLEKEQQIEQQKSNITSLISIINYNHYQTEGTTNGTAEGTTEEHQKNTKGYTNKNKKNEKKYKRAISVLDFFSPVINGWNKSKLVQTIDGFISTRKTKQISSGVIQKEFEYWKQFPNETINAALTAYVEGQLWESGKGEKYFRGIIRGKDKAIQKESNQSLFQKAF